MWHVPLHLFSMCPWPNAACGIHTCAPCPDLGAAAQHNNSKKKLAETHAVARGHRMHWESLQIWWCGGPGRTWCWGCAVLYIILRCRLACAGAGACRRWQQGHPGAPHRHQGGDK